MGLTCFALKRDGLSITCVVKYGCKADALLIFCTERTENLHSYSENRMAANLT